MIISELHTDKVLTKIIAEHDKLTTFEDLPPARVRVTIRLPGVYEMTNAHLKCVLHVQRTGVFDLPPSEEGRLVLELEETTVFQPFDTVFLTNAQYSIRVEFFISQSTPESQQEDCAGIASASLSDIIEARNERLHVPLNNMLGERIPDTYAELGLEWLRFLDDKMVLELRVRVQKSVGWPFSNARPFFVLYRWDPRPNTWTPIYRSEVLNRVNIWSQGKGFMVFELMEIDLMKQLDGDPERPLRLEFFHYKTKGNPKMLGYFKTSVKHLRLSRNEPNLNLELSTFAEGELVGQLRVDKSKIGAGISYFCLEAVFGGEVIDDFVFFDMSLTDLKKRKGWRREGKPSYTISRYGDSNRWEKVYRSESNPKVMGNIHKYKIAKLSQRRLNGGRKTRPISIMFQFVDGIRVVLGHVGTTVEDLLTADTGAVLPLEGAGVGSGHIRLELAEKSSGRTYFSLHCVIER